MLIKLVVVVGLSTKIYFRRDEIILDSVEASAELMAFAQVIRNYHSRSRPSTVSSSSRGCRQGAL